MIKSDLFWGINITLVAIVIGSMVHGIGLLPFIEDKTYLSWFIGGLIVVGLVFQAFDKFDTAGWLSRQLVRLGLLGTIVGLLTGLREVDVTQLADLAYLQEIVGMLLAGMGTAYYTTFLGFLGFLWLSTNAFVIKGREE